MRRIRGPDTLDRETKFPPVTLFRNWAGNVRFEVERRVAPRSLSELQQVVKSSKRVRVAGKGHSFNQSLHCAESIVSLHNLRRVLAIDSDRHTVEVEAGITLFELNRLLAERGLSISSPGDVDYQSVGGLISTGSHGSHLGFATLSDFVVEVKLADGDGRLMALGPSDGAAFQAACVSLGMCGVVYSVTLQCEPLFHLAKKQRVVSIREAFAELEEEARQPTPQHLEFWYFPFTDRVLLIRKERIAAEDAKGISWGAHFSNVMVENVLLGILLEVFALAPRFVPRLMNALSALSGAPEQNDVAWKIYRNVRLFKAIDCEMAIPFDSALEALDHLRRCVEIHANRTSRPYFLPLPVNIRFVRASKQGLLNPAADRRTCYLDISTYQRFKNHEAFFGDFEEGLSPLGGRPHWGKLFVGRPLHNYPSENVTRFRDVRAQLDPEQKFSNAFLRARLPELFD
jgi:L-gulonolactone oxidase